MLWLSKKSSIPRAKASTGSNREAFDAGYVPKKESDAQRYSNPPQHRPELYRRGAAKSSGKQVSRQRYRTERPIAPPITAIVPSLN